MSDAHEDGFPLLFDVVTGNHPPHPSSRVSADSSHLTPLLLPTVGVPSVLGFSTSNFDHIGYLSHHYKGKWRKRLIALQGDQLLYFALHSSPDSQQQPKKKPKNPFALFMKKANASESASAARSATPAEPDLRYQLDLRLHQIELDVHREFLFGENTQQSQNVSTTFQLVGRGLPGGNEMLMKANNPEDCKRWCRAFRSAIKLAAERDGCPP